MKIKLRRKNKSFTYLTKNSKFKYAIFNDEAAGRKDVYYVWILNADDPVTIGRELDLKTVRDLINDYETYGPKYWYGDRETVLKTLKKISALRYARFRKAK